MKESLTGFFQPTGAWFVIASFVAITALLTFGHAGGLLQFGFPFAAFGVGLYLYHKAPILYIGFTWWVWFLSPWVRRMVDYYSSWVDPSPILSAPHLVTMVMGITLIKQLPNLKSEGSLPFILAIVAVIYSYFIGIISFSFISATTGVLNWLTPMVFAYHISFNWQNNLLYQKITQRVFIWAAIILGIYGIIQFLIVPPWDGFWMKMTASYLNSIGTPMPLKVRVFSTVNGPFAFAIVLMVSLLLLLINVKPIGFAASGIGYLSFLLTSVRSCWIGWVIGLMSLIGSLKANMQMRLFITIMVLAIAVIPLTLMDPFAGVISKRISTFSNAQQDESFNDRTNGLNYALDLVLSQGLGAGMGANDVKSGIKGADFGTIGPRDSTILDLLYTLGWVGSIPYLLGLGLVLAMMLSSNVVKYDNFAAASKAIALGGISQIFFGSVFIGISGSIIWVFMAHVIAAQRYHNHLKQITTKSS